MVVRSFPGDLQADRDWLAACSQNRGTRAYSPTASSSLLQQSELSHLDTFYLGGKEQPKSSMEAIPCLTASSLWRRCGETDKGSFFFYSFT